MPDIPSTAKQPQDHQAAKAEAIDPESPITFTYDGVEYTIDPAFRDDVEILEDLENEHQLRVVKRVLGVDQWDAWKEANRGANGRVKATVAKPFLESLFKELGAGN